jgi:tetratricopeptide (TPR) repeat protein
MRRTGFDFEGSPTKVWNTRHTTTLRLHRAWPSDVMKVGRGVATVLLSIVALAYVHAGAASAQEPPTPCAAPDLLVKAGLLESAAVAYGELLKKDPVHVCVLPGLQALEAARKATAKEKAEAAFEAVRRLERHGFHDDAVAALKKVIADHPTATIPSDLDRLHVGTPGYIRGYEQYIAPSLDFVLAPLIGTLTAGAAIVLLVIAGRRVRAYREKWQFRVTDLAASDASLGKTLAAAINDAIWRLETSGGGDRMWRGESNAQDFNVLTALVGAVPQVKLASLAEPLLKMFWPARAITLGGAVHPPSDRLGVGLTLTLTLEGHADPFVESVTLWEHDFEPWRHETGDKDVSGYYRLINLAAVWTEYRLDQQLRRRQPNIPAVTLATKSWRSYALYASGADWDVRGERARAAAQYIRSLEIDPGNWLSAINLANAESVLVDPGDGTDPAKTQAYLVATKRALARLEWAERLLPGPPADGVVLEPSWYRARYLRSAIEIERATVQGAAVSADVVVAALDLASDMERALTTLEAKGLATDKERTTYELLAENEGLVVSLLAIALARTGPPTPTEPALANRSDLLREINAERKRRAETPSDPTRLGHDRLALYLQSGQPLVRDVAHNLAAYECIVAGSGALDRALDLIGAAAVAQDERWAEWLERDPTLRPLHGATHGDRFKKILEGCVDLGPYQAVPKTQPTEPKPAQHQIELTVKPPVVVRTT